MLKNHFISILRNLVRGRSLVLINVLGFALGMASCLLIGLFLRNEFSYDRHNEKLDRIYRVGLDRVYPERNVRWAPVAPAVRDGLIEEFPEIEQATRVSMNSTTVSSNDEKAFEEKVAMVDTSFLNVFSAEFIQGDPTTALQDPSSIVITESTASKYFEGQDAIGKSLSVDHVGLYKVTGVIRDVPVTAHFHYSCLINFGQDKQTDFTVWGNNFGYYTYILLHKDADAKSLEAKLPKMSEKYLRKDEGDSYNKWRADGNNYVYFLQPLKDIHLYSDLKWEMEANGNYRYMYIFGGIGILILVIACINFMNLSTARYTAKAKEVGIRKVLGSLRRQLVHRFMLESVFLCMIAFVIALVITQLALPGFNVLLGKQIAVHIFSDPVLLPVLVLASLFIGLASGYYPAMLLSSFKPVDVLSSVSAFGMVRSRFRNRLVVFQFAISFFLIAGTWIVFSQTQFMLNKDLGMSKENVLVIDNGMWLPDKQVFKHEISTIKDVIRVGGSSGIPGTIEGAGTFQPKGFKNQQELNMSMLGIDTGLIKAWNIELTAGRDFVESDYTDTSRYVIINETAVKQFGWPDDPIGKELLNGGGRTLRVAGVVKDFHLESMHHEIRPLIILPSKDWINKISVKVSSGNLSQTISALEKKWKQFVPNKPFQYFFLDEFQGTLYRTEHVTGVLFVIFASLAILIASLGLFGLSAFMAEQRTREIGIRKVVGASVKAICLLLIKDLAKLVMVGIVLSIPLSWYAMTNWLQGYAYKIDLTVTPFIAAAIISLGIAVMTIGYQALKAALVNPVTTLRNQ